MNLIFKDCTFGYRKGRPIFSGFDLEIDRDSSVLLGPNGAGKSTLLKLAAGIHAPWSGRIEFGHITTSHRKHRREWRTRIGWLPQEVTPVPGLRVREQVAYAGWLKGLSKAEAWTASRSALSRMNLLDLSERPSHQLSGGQLRRLGISQALVHRADIVLLDEPTAGLDPAQRGSFRKVIEGLANDVQVVISTHQTEDLADIFDSVIVLCDGRRVHQDSVSDFLAHADPNTPAERKAESAYGNIISGDD
ncbi:ATP-binding cassette domain-containing protein [Streptomyces sp. NPDC048506]|uniref:ATP-binding cassette domain-containing protein n=1 Tax=Streptomyces sp. NPDC048506 TaxID=3155028 RepID=UPI00341E1FFB